MSRPPSPTRDRLSARAAVRLTLLVALVLTACTTAPPLPRVTAELPLASAVGMAADEAMQHMVRQQGLDLARLLNRPTRIYLAPVLQSESRQQTVTTVRVRELIAVHLKSQHRGLELVPYTEAAAAGSEVRLDSTLTAVTLPDGRRSADRMLLALRLVSLKDGRTLASSQAAVSDPALDGTPMAFYRESPFSLPPPQAQEVERALTERERTVPIARLDEAGSAYDTGRFDRALELYRSAATLPGADTLQALIGRYLASVRSGKDDESREAFARIVTLGLGTRSMGVKLLFAPGRTDYIDDPAISRPYPDWLREIAKQAGESTTCLQVVGHSSRTGTEDFNVALSAQRAEAVRQQLEAANPALVRRIEASGVGWRENLVGTGSDDLKDAVDRRVEFKVTDCR